MFVYRIEIIFIIKDIDTIINVDHKLIRKIDLQVLRLPKRVDQNSFFILFRGMELTTEGN